MNLFLKKVLRFLIIPCIVFIIILTGYIYYDPFMVVKSYDDYSHSFRVNRGFVSTQMFLKNYDKYKYNSFIFGSSRIFGYHVSSWKKHLDDDAVVFSFDAYGDKIKGMYHKLKMMDERGVDIKNVLLCFDTDYTFRHSQNEPYYLYIEHPFGSDISWFEFHYTTFSAYINPPFLISMYGQELFNIENDYVNTHYSKPGGIIYDKISNEPARPDLDMRIANEKDYFDTGYFHKIDTVIPPDYGLIDLDMQKYLKDIKTIFDKHKTNYKVVLNPLYNQNIFHSDDMESMKKILGAEHIFDYTGTNWITTDKHNYYEESHFRPFIGDSIMSEIYANKKDSIFNE